MVDPLGCPEASANDVVLCLAGRFTTGQASGLQVATASQLTDRPIGSHWVCSSSLKSTGTAADAAAADAAAADSDNCAPIVRSSTRPVS
jgi:hypothetical protein